MKTKILLFLVFAFTIPGLNAQTTHTISVSGFAYTPAELTVNTGETVQFEGSASHPVAEVAEAVWNDNGSAPLEGGFAFPDGNGSVSFNAPGVHYYVCTSHVASNGMKGKINVVGATGLDEISVSGKYAVYPVPLTGSELTISSGTSVSETIEVSVYDMAGNLRISSLGSIKDGKYHVDCSMLPAGLFIMKLETTDGSAFAKLVKE